MIDLVQSHEDFSDTSISVSVDVPPDFLSMTGFDTALKAAMNAMANEARDFWVTAAGQRLKSSRVEYQQAIRVGVVDDHSFVIELSGGFLPYALEVGTPPYDMNIARGQVAPLNVNRQTPFLNPTVFRRGTGEAWKHPGFPGFNMAQDVVRELREVILPKYISKIVEEL